MGIGFDRDGEDNCEINSCNKIALHIDTHCVVLYSDLREHHVISTFLGVGIQTVWRINREMRLLACLSVDVRAKLIVLDVTVVMVK